MNKSSTLRWLKSKRVAVLKGGWSSERSISLKTGEAVEKSFRRLGIHPLGIDVQPNILHVIKKKRIQFCFIALHGPFGEDGRIQSCLEVIGIPFTGSGSVASGLAMDKHLSKQLFNKMRVPTPPGLTIFKQDFRRDRDGAFQKVKSLLKGSALFVKPVDQGSAIGVSRVTRPAEISAALKKCFAISAGALVEKLIVGRELTVGILGSLPLPVTEIVSKHDFYDFYSKYAQGGSRHITPAPISARAARRTQEIALKAFRALGCSVYGRVDLMMKSEKKQYVLEVNTIPGMTNTSLLPEAANSAGINFDELVLDIVSLSLKERKIKI